MRKIKTLLGMIRKRTIMWAIIDVVVVSVLGYGTSHGSKLDAWILILLVAIWVLAGVLGYIADDLERRCDGKPKEA